MNESKIVSDLVDFIRARLDEDEQIAREAGSAPWSADIPRAVHVDTHGQAEKKHAWGRFGLVATVEHEANQLHIARHDPARVLLDVEVKRRIVELCAVPLIDVTGPNDRERRYVPGEGPGWGEPALRLLALPYADHPDYRQEWRP